MSLPHALLTALVERPASGSDLAARFDRSIGYFWNASHQQIYRELARLEASGLIESLPEQSGRGRKRAYQILAPGRAELERWVGQGEAAPPLRDELMVRLWAEATIGPAGENLLPYACIINARNHSAGAGTGSWTSPKRRSRFAYEASAASSSASPKSGHRQWVK